jgi:replicative DNA helicase
LTTPHEIEVVGGLLQAPGLVEEVRGEVRAEEFSNADTAKVYREILRRHDAREEINAVLVGEAVKDLDVAVRAARDVCSTVQTIHHARAIRKGARSRRLADDLAQASRDLRGGADPDEIWAHVASQAESGSGKLSGAEYTDFDGIVNAAMETMDEAAARRREAGTVGVPTGLRALDECTGGLQAPRLVVLAARPSLGKTALANQIALHAAANGHPVGVCSLEMGRDELAIRALANRFELNGSALAFGDEGEIARLGEALGREDFRSLPLYVDTDTYNLDGIVSRLAQWKRKHDIALGIVDHIGLIDVPATPSPVERLGRVSRMLKVTAKQLGIPILAVSQLNRRVEAEKRRPFLADLRDSGSIEQDADIAVFLHVAETEEGNQWQQVEVGLLKNRQGRKGWLPAPLWFNGRTQRFRESGAREPPARAAIMG